MGAWLIISFSRQEENPVATSVFPPCLPFTRREHRGDASTRKHHLPLLCQGQIEFRISTQNWHDEQTTEHLVLIRMQ